MKAETKQKLIKLVSNLYIAGFIVTLSFLIYSVGKAASAITIMYYQTTNTSSVAITNPSPANKAFYQSLGTGLIGTPTTIEVYISGSAALSNTRAITIYRCDNNNLNSCTNQVSYGSSDNLLFGASPAFDTVSISGLVFDPTKYYFLVITGPGGGTNMQLYGSTDANSYSTGEAKIWDGSALATASPVLDFYFVIAGSYEQSILFPTIPVTFSSTTVGSIYASASSTMQDCSIYSGGFFSSSTLAGLGCQFTNALQSAAIWLFVPQPDDAGMETLNSAIQSFQDVFPFNIFYNFASVVNNNSSGYTAGSDTISINWGQSIPGIISITSSTVKQYLGTTSYNTIREVESYGIWLLTGFEIIAVVTGFHFISKKPKKK